ncbi:MAG: hypothetical protein NXH79_07025 [Rhodobacteraceae bacterium]|nr:hypothetical protein [Paracoccaceae bacterium]
MFINLQMLILLILAGLGAALSVFYQRQADKLADRLPPEDKQTFYTRYRNRSDRDDMPGKFADLATATDKARGARGGVTMILGIAVLYFFL